VLECALESSLESSLERSWNVLGMFAHYDVYQLIKKLGVVKHPVVINFKNKNLHITHISRYVCHQAIRFV